MIKTLNQLILWQPKTQQQGRALFLFMTASAALLGYLHWLSGPSYEFHLFFSVPVTLAAWWLGFLPGVSLSIVIVAFWFGIDMHLGNTSEPAVALALNSTMRLILYCFEVWVLSHFRRVLNRESSMAREDTLTKLPSRREFIDRGQNALALAQRQELAIAAVFIDLDRFKEVNDTKGHAEGDKLLACVAGVLRQHVRVSDVVGRLGGDEFSMILSAMNYATAQHYVNSLRLSLLNAMSEQGWPVTFSIGVACYQRAPKELDSLLSDADALMYEVKRGGRDRVFLREITG